MDITVNNKKKKFRQTTIYTAATMPAELQLTCYKCLPIKSINHVNSRIDIKVPFLTGIGMCLIILHS